MLDAQLWSLQKSDEALSAAPAANDTAAPSATAEPVASEIANVRIKKGVAQFSSESIIKTFCLQNVVAQPAAEDVRQKTSSMKRSKKKKKDDVSETFFLISHSDRAPIPLLDSGG